jgi:hypothetical protein
VATRHINTTSQTCQTQLTSSQRVGNHLCDRILYTNNDNVLNNIYNNKCMNFSDCKNCNKCICTNTTDNNITREDRSYCKGHLNCHRSAARNELTIFKNHEITMMCGGRKTHCVLDTGADLCVVSSLLVEDGSTDVITYPSKVKLCVLADGDSIPVLGETVMTCQLGSETYRLRFIVIDNKDTSQIILGCDFLKGVNAMIDFRQSKVFIDKSTKIEYQNELAKLENGNITCPTSGVNIVHSGYIGGYCIQHPKSYKDALLTNLAPVKTKSVDVPRLPKSHALVHVTSSESWTTLDQPPVTSRNVTFATMKNPPRIVGLKHARNMQLNNKG